MDRTDKFLAISQTLPGLENFLRDVLSSEVLSKEADQQRKEFLKKLEIVSSPPSLPPRPVKLAGDGRAPLPNVPGSNVIASGDESQTSTYSHYRNDHNDDPVDFASQQRELSRNYTFSRAYAARRDLYGGLELPVLSGATKASPRGSTRSSGSDETIYERLSIGGDITQPEDDSRDSKISNETSPNTSIGPRGTVGRSSVSKGRLASGWFKKEVKVSEEVYISDLSDNVIQGYLKDMKTNKRRWCVIKDEKLYIFKTRDDPAMHIIDLPNCDIGVDDKKKISYSFRLSQQTTGSPLVHLAIEEGHDLSPWMSAVMAAAVRRSSIYKPISPLRNTSFGSSQERTHFPFGFMTIDIKPDEDGDGISNTYEVPIELLPEMVSSSGYLPTHTSTPIRPDNSDDNGYNPPLPPLPPEAMVITDSSSSDSSSDEDDDNKKIVSRKERKKSLGRKTGVDNTDSTNVPRVRSFTLGPHGEIIYDEVPQDLEGATLRPGNHNDYSGHRLSFASDEGGDVREEKSSSLTRKRSSTALTTVSQESLGSDAEMMPKPQPPRKSSLLYGPRMKRRRKQSSAVSESKFLQDQEASHSGVLYLKRPLGVWSKRYCKLIGEQLTCYRHADHEKPSLSLSLLGHDITLIDSKESKRAYAFKISKPNSESYFFSTDSRVSVERWIEVLSLAATGRQDIIVPYPPYFQSASGDELERRKSMESLSLSESLSVDSGDTLDELDDSGPSKSSHSSVNARTVEDPYDDTSGFAADEREDSDARELDSEAQHKRRERRAKSPRSPKLRQQRDRDRILKRRKAKVATDGSGTESPSTMSPPHSVFVSDSGNESKPEPTEDVSMATGIRDVNVMSKREKKGWADTLKLRQSRFRRAHTLAGIVTSHETSKTKPNKRNTPSYTHLLALFDKEGRFSGFLTEVKASKYSTTQLRRWCVVKNGALHLYNKECDETPVTKLNLVEMWLTDESDDAKHKYSFVLHGVNDKVVKFQVGSKEEFDKWMGVLKIFTGIRVERPVETCVDETVSQPAKPASTKDEATSVNTFAKRSSIRMKLPQRMNVMEIFKKSNSSYNFENPNTEDIIPANELHCVNYSGGYLTEICIADEDNYMWKQSRWCTVKDSELLVFTDGTSSDPIKKMVLYNVNVEDTSEPESGLYRFKIHRGNEEAVFLAHDKADLDNWLKLLQSARDMYGKETREAVAKCRMPSPKNVFSHHRSRSETLPQTVSLSSASWYSSSSSPEKRKSYGSTSMSTGSEGSTDTLMNGHLQEVVRGSERVGLNGSHGELQNTVRNRWCMVTSENMFIYESEDSTQPSKEWRLADVKVKEENDETTKGMFGFRVKHDDEELLLQNTNREVIAQWLSVLLRYCPPIEGDKSLVTQKLKMEGRKPSKSCSDSNLKSGAASEQESKIKRTLSEGRASGRRLLRKISEDNILRKYSRSDLFKSSSWKGSLDKVNVKMRDKSTLSSHARDIERRFSCGSIFDSDGKYSGFLMEQTSTALCRSQVRRWCVVQDDLFYVYDQPRMEKARRAIPLIRAKLTNESNLDEDLFVFRVDCEDDQFFVFRAANRTDLEKWTTAISVKIEVLKSRAQRQARRNVVVINEEVEPSITSDTACSEPTSVPVFSLGDSTESLATIESRQVSDADEKHVCCSSEPVTEPQGSSDKEGVSYEDGGDENVTGEEDKEPTVAPGSDVPPSPQLVIVEDMKRISLQDVTIDESSDADTFTSQENNDPSKDVINLGTIQIPWEDVIDASDSESAPRSSYIEPAYVYSDDQTSSATGDPIYENLPGSSNTLSGLTIRPVDLGGGRPRSHGDTMFVDMLPKRSSKYDLGPLYENVHFVPDDLPLHDEVFGLKAPSEPNSPSPSHEVTKTFERFTLHDRLSFASDYSGIVGENLLDEVGSIDSDRSRSGTNSSRDSTSDMRAVNPAFGKELLDNILGFPVSADEAQEISEYCARCDANAEEQERLQSLHCGTDIEISLSEDLLSDSKSRLVDVNNVERQTSSKILLTDPGEALRRDETAMTHNSLLDVSSDQAMGHDLRLDVGSDPRGSLAESSSSSIHDTYFGCSTSDESEEFVDCAQELRSDQEFPEKTYDANKPPAVLSTTETPLNQPSARTHSVGSSSSNEHYDTYFGRSSESELEKSSEAENAAPQQPTKDLREDDTSIILVGRVVSHECLSAPCETTPPDLGEHDKGDGEGDTKEGTSAFGATELTSSQVDIIRAVTEAFQGIMDMTEDVSSEDTKL